MEHEHYANEAPRDVNGARHWLVGGSRRSDTDGAPGNGSRGLQQRFSTRNVECRVVHLGSNSRFPGVTAWKSVGNAVSRCLCPASANGPGAFPVFQEAGRVTTRDKIVSEFSAEGYNAPSRIRRSFSAFWSDYAFPRITAQALAVIRKLLLSFPFGVFCPTLRG
jgi:hypothetical protein